MTNNQYVNLRLTRLHKLAQSMCEIFQMFLTVPVVADGYSLTERSVAEVEEVGLDKLREEVL